MSITSSAALAAIIDHTILRADAVEAEIEQFCAEALQWNFASVCVNPINIPRAVAALRGSSVKACSVVGFPLGATPTAVKRREAEWAISEGAAEVDMVISVGTLKSVGAGPVGEEIAALKSACGAALLKVILETALLTDDEIVASCLAAKAAGADFVKTSTGFIQKGATVEAVTLMRRTVGPEMGVKACGGIRSFAEAMAMIGAGADRIGTSRGIALMREASF